jgi:hypothetical protein
MKLGVQEMVVVAVGTIGRKIPKKLNAALEYACQSNDAQGQTGWLHDVEIVRDQPVCDY